jgi:hypothetical protein
MGPRKLTRRRGGQQGPGRPGYRWVPPRIPRPDEAFEDKHYGRTALERAQAAAVAEHKAAIDTLEKTARGRTILRVVQAVEPGRSPEDIAKGGQSEHGYLLPRGGRRLLPRVHGDLGPI